DEVPGGPVPDLGARRHREIQVDPGLSGHVLSLTMLPPLRLPVDAVAVVEQCGEVRVGPHIDAPSGPAVAAVRTALGDEFFAAEARGARPAGAGDDMHDCAVDEHHEVRGTGNGERGT